MKTFIALLALVAVAAANPAGPLVQLMINVNALASNPVSIENNPAVPGGPAVQPIVPGPVNVVDTMPVVDPINVIDVMPVLPGEIISVMPGVNPVVPAPAPIELPTPVLPGAILPPPIVLPTPALPGIVQPEAAINLPEILN